MELSSERNDLENVGGVSVGIRPLRAGLRLQPVKAEPAGLFAAVEMTVLVIVAALAMASIIVSGNEMVDRESAAPAPHRAENPVAGSGQGAKPGAEAPRGAVHGQPAHGVDR